MTALRAVPTPDPPPITIGDDAAVDAGVDLAPDTVARETDTRESDTRESGALHTDPRTDPESLVLCALLWSTDTDTSRRIVDALVPADFLEPAYGELFTLVADLVTGEQPYDPASVAAVLHRAGGGQKDAPLRRTLNDVVTAAAPAVAAGHYAGIVMSQSYRRSFHVAGQRLVQAAEEGPEDGLFDYLVELGIAQRAAWKRLNAFRAGTERS